MNEDTTELTEESIEDVVVEAAPVEVEADKTNAGAVRAGKRAPSPAGQAVSGEEKDRILLSSCVFKNLYAQKSLTIHHVQRRLAELGYPDAYTDRDGWYGDLTKLAVAAYQRDNKLDGDGVIDMATLESLFADDVNVVIAE